MIAWDWPLRASCSGYKLRRSAPVTAMARWLILCGTSQGSVACSGFPRLHDQGMLVRVMRRSVGPPPATGVSLVRAAGLGFGLSLPLVQDEVAQGSPERLAPSIFADPRAFCAASPVGRKTLACFGPDWPADRPSGANDGRSGASRARGSVRASCGIGAVQYRSPMSGAAAGPDHRRGDRGRVARMASPPCPSGRMASGPVRASLT